MYRRKVFLIRHTLHRMTGILGELKYEFVCMITRNHPWCRRRILYFFSFVTCVIDRSLQSSYFTDVLPALSPVKSPKTVVQYTLERSENFKRLTLNWSIFKAVLKHRTKVLSEEVQTAWSATALCDTFQLLHGVRTAVNWHSSNGLELYFEVTRPETFALLAQTHISHFFSDPGASRCVANLSTCLVELHNKFATNSFIHPNAGLLTPWRKFPLKH